MKSEKQCRIVNYNSENFSNEVFDSLRTDRVFAVTKLPEELKRAIKDLFDSGDNFFDSLHDYAQNEYPAKIENRNTRGLFGPQEHALLCNNGARFFVAMNTEGGINNEKMPIYQDSPVMSNASVIFNSYTDSLIDRILESIANNLDLDGDELKKSILGDAAIGLTRYYPITQNRIAQLFRNNVLAVTGNNVHQFDSHRDVNPITLLVYRGGPRGLMVKDPESGNLIPLSIDCGDEAHIIIFTGTMLKEFTNANIGALEHEVVASPKEQHLEAQMHPHHWRFTLGKFTYCNLEQITPMKTKKDGLPINPPQPRKHQRQYPIAQAKFFSDHLATENVIREKVRAKEFPADVAKMYPATVKYEKLYVDQLGEDSVGICAL